MYKKNCIILSALIVSAFFSCPVFSQSVSILDQGYNTNMTHKASGVFVEQHCISFPDRSVETAGPTRPGEIILSVFTASLCNNGLTQQFFSPIAAYYPRAFLEPIGNEIYFAGINLTHGRDTSNALWQFNENIYQQLFQVYGLAGNRDPEASPSLPDVVERNNSYTSNGGQHIEAALRFLSANARPDLGGIAISTVVGSLSQTTRLCTRGFGQDAVDRLNAKGIAVVAGLANQRIPVGVRTWPNCLRGVINVGRTDGFSQRYNGNGVGSNNIEFVMKSEVSSGGNIETGNSLVSPRIAGAYSMLHKAFPESSVDDKTLALIRASSKSFTRDGYTRRRITKSQMAAAILELDAIVNAPPPPPPIAPNEGGDNIATGVIAQNKGRFGTLFDGDRDDVVVINLPFAATKSAKTSKETIIESSLEPDDVEIEMLATFDNSSDSVNKFSIFVNNRNVATTNIIPNGVEKTVKITISRKYFDRDDNIVEIKSFAPKWGLRDPKLKVTEALNLDYGQMLKGGWGNTPRIDYKRWTGMRFLFDAATPSDSYISIKSRLGDGDKVEVLVNNTSLGYLTTGGQPESFRVSTFALPKSVLESSNNILRLRRSKSFDDLSASRSWVIFEAGIFKSNPSIANRSISVVGGRPKSGVEFSVVSRFANIGDSPSPASEIEYYLSQDPKINRNLDTKIATFAAPSIPLGLTQTFSHELTLDLVDEDSFLGVCFKPTANESVTQDNCSIGVKVSSKQIDIAPIIMLLLDD